MMSLSLSLSLLMLLMLTLMTVGATATTHSFTSTSSTSPLVSSFDFASSAAGAKVLASSPGVLGASNVLSSNADKYLFMESNTRVQWIVIQLSEDVTPDTITLLNREHYSSGIAAVQVLASVHWPTDRWLQLGEIKAISSRQRLSFPLPIRYNCRFIRLRFLSCFSPERYCTLTQVQVFGTPTLQGAASHLDEEEHGSADEALVKLLQAQQRLVPVHSSTHNHVCQEVPLFARLDQCAKTTMPSLSPLLPMRSDFTAPATTPSVYTKLTDKLRELRIHQFLLVKAAKELQAEFLPMSDKVFQAVRNQEEHSLQYHVLETSLICEHTNMVKSSKLPQLLDELERVVPLLSSEMKSAQRDFSLLILFTIITSVCAFLWLVLQTFTLDGGAVHKGTVEGDDPANWVSK